MEVYMESNIPTHAVTEDNGITIFVPLFRNGEQQLGIHVNIFERFNAWSFTMKSDLADHMSNLKELFSCLCIEAGLGKRVTCALDLEIGRRDGDYEFIIMNSGATACGDFFTLDAIFHLLSTAFIPYWLHIAEKINAFDQGYGFDAAVKYAEETLGDWSKFDLLDVEEIHWEKAWHSANSRYDRQQLIRGDNWKLPTSDMPLERLPEHTSKCPAMH